MKSLHQIVKTNWKLFLLLLGAILIVGIFLFFVGVSGVSTDKVVYSANENITVSFSDFRLYRCNMSPLLMFSRETPEGWQPIRINPNIGFSPGESVCLDGRKVVAGGTVGQEEESVPDTKSACSLFERPYLSGDYTWSGVIYESKEEKRICEDLKEPVASLQSMPAPPGKYKVSFGFAEKIFEVQQAQDVQTSSVDTSSWQTYRNEEFGFEVKYPPGGEITKTNYGPRIILPLVEEGTNLFEKYLDIAVDGPSAHTGHLASSTTVSLKGTIFAKEIRGGAAVGNLYDTEAYIADYKGKKYNLSFTLHSGNIGNYDPGIRPKEFNSKEEKKIFDQILSTFRFVK